MFIAKNLIICLMKILFKVKLLIIPFCGVIFSIGVLATSDVDFATSCNEVKL